MTGFCREIQITNVKSAIQAVNNGPTYLLGWQFQNVNAARRFVKLYDAIATNVTPGTTVGRRDVMVPAGDSLILMLTKPLFYPNGISVRATTARGWTDTTDPADHDIECVFYIA